MNRAFSLVELSIVLVILGLLTGGILAGQSLIRAAELRSVQSEASRYITAAQSFRDKYFALPGDMANATKFWGDDNAACPDAAVTNGTPGTCNGNGDGALYWGSAGTTAEYYQFWKQLALAGLIEGTYSGLVATGAGGINSSVGQNVPPSKMGNSGWNVIRSGNGNDAFNFQSFTLDYGNALMLGGSNPGTYSNGPLLKPEEAWNIDTKMDDGKPGSGRVIGGESPLGSCTNAASYTDYTSSYLLSATGKVCYFLFPKSLN